jgi:NAD(P)-dependent dehydrogenase (short-subunit alcohol dehydrogenase family)
MAALITGGDSGIGRAVAVLYARRRGRGHRLPERGRGCRGHQALRRSGRPGLPADPRRRARPAFCRDAAQAHERFGRLDILVNNAAFQEHAEKLTDLTEDRFDMTMKTNVYGYFHMAKAVLPYLKRGAAIINTGSVTGCRARTSARLPPPRARSMRSPSRWPSNLLEQGIRVNAVAPGPVWTPLNPADAPAEKVAQFGADTDMKRPAQPQELSPAYVFLAAPCCSSYITGIVLPVTGSVGG